MRAKKLTQQIKHLTEGKVSEGKKFGNYGDDVFGVAFSEDNGGVKMEFYHDTSDPDEWEAYLYDYDPKMDKHIKLLSNNVTTAFKQYFKAIDKILLGEGKDRVSEGLFANKKVKAKVQSMMSNANEDDFEDTMVKQLWGEDFDTDEIAKELGLDSEAEFEEFEMAFFQAMADARVSMLSELNKKLVKNLSKFKV